MAGISSRQALVLLRAKIGTKVRVGKLDRVTRDLAKDGRVTGGAPQERWITPDDLDVIEGELRRMSAGWYQRRNVRGDLDGWVVLDGGERFLCRLPFYRSWDNVQKVETEAIPETIGTWEWPTARLTGVLDRVEDCEGKPAYEWTSVELLDSEVVEALSEQWQTGAKVRAE